MWFIYPLLDIKGSMIPMMMRGGAIGNWIGMDIILSVFVDDYAYYTGIEDMIYMYIYDAISVSGLLSKSVEEPVTVQLSEDLQIAGLLSAVY